MEYKQVTQTSRPYEYGEGKEFITRGDALHHVKKLEESIKTQLALEKLYALSECKIIEEGKAFQIVVTTKVPIVVDEPK